MCSSQSDFELKMAPAPAARVPKDPARSHVVLYLSEICGDWAEEACFS